MAEVIENVSLPSLTAARMSAVETGLVAPVSSAQPSLTALDLAMPNTIGVVEVLAASLTMCLVSPIEIHIEEAGQTAS